LCNIGNAVEMLDSAEAPVPLDLAGYLLALRFVEIAFLDPSWA
jgi:hypothetical protein